MRHLAVRFVRPPPGVFRVATADGPTTALNQNIHMVDPHLDMRDRFEGEKAITLSRSILARKMSRSIDLLSIRDNYYQWWDAFRAWETEDEEKRPERIALRARLLDQSPGLLNALRLPNDVDSDQPAELLELDELSDPIRDRIAELAGQIISEGRKNPRPPLLLFRQRLSNALQQLICASAAEGAKLVSVPHLVRPAVVEACSMDLDSFPVVVDGDTYLFLTGVGLPSLLSPLVRRKFVTKSASWPLALFSVGSVYHFPSFSQHSQLSLLVLHTEWPKCADAMFQIASVFDAFFRQLGLSFIQAPVPAPSLWHYERSALALSSLSSSNLEFARFSAIGDFVSRRARILAGPDLFAQMAFAQLNLDALSRQILLTLPIDSFFIF